MFLILAGQVDPGFWNQCGEARDEVKGFEDDMSGAVVPGGFEGVADLARFGERQAFAPC